MSQINYYELLKKKQTAQTPDSSGNNPTPNYYKLLKRKNNSQFITQNSQLDNLPQLVQGNSEQEKNDVIVENKELNKYGGDASFYLAVKEAKAKAKQNRLIEKEKWEQKGIQDSQKNPYSSAFVSGAENLIAGTNKALSGLPKHLTLNNKDLGIQDDISDDLTYAEKRLSYNKGVMTEKEGDSTLKTMVRATLNSAPATIASALTAGTSLALTGISSAGSKYYEMEDREDLSEANKITSAIFTGTMETATEYLGTLGNIKATKTLLKKIGYEAMEQGIKKQVKSNLLKVGGRYLAGSGEEGLEELVNSVSVDIMDNALGVQNKSVKEITKDAMLAAASGAFSSALISSPTATIQGISAAKQDFRQKTYNDLKKGLELGIQSADKGDIQNANKVLKQFVEAKELIVPRLNSNQQEEIKSLLTNLTNKSDLFSFNEIVRQNVRTPEQPSDKPSDDIKTENSSHNDITIPDFNSQIIELKSNLNNNNPVNESQVIELMNQIQNSPLKENQKISLYDKLESLYDDLSQMNESKKLLNQKDNLTKELTFAKDHHKISDLNSQLSQVNSSLDNISKSNLDQSKKILDKIAELDTNDPDFDDHFDSVQGLTDILNIPKAQYQRVVNALADKQNERIEKQYNEKLSDLNDQFDYLSYRIKNTKSKSKLTDLNNKRNTVSSQLTSAQNDLNEFLLSKNNIKKTVLASSTQLHQNNLAETDDKARSLDRMKPVNIDQELNKTRKTKPIQNEVQSDPFIDNISKQINSLDDSNYDNILASFEVLDEPKTILKLLNDLEAKTIKTILPQSVKLKIYDSIDSKRKYAKTIAGKPVNTDKSNPKYSLSENDTNKESFKNTIKNHFPDSSLEFVTDDNYKSYNRLAKSFGLNGVILFKSNNTPVNGVLYNGHIFININSNEPVKTIVLHEIIHQVRLANEMNYFLMQTCLENSPDFKMYKMQNTQYLESLGYSQDEMQEELIAHFVSENVQDSSFWDYLLKNDLSLFHKLRVTIKYHIKSALKFFSKESSQYHIIKKMESNIIQAQKEAGKNNPDITKFFKTQLSQKDILADKMINLPFITINKKLSSDHWITEMSKAKAFALQNLRSKLLLNKDNNKRILISSNGIKETLHNSDFPKIKSVYYLDSLIESAVFLKSLPNEDNAKHPDIKAYEYYLNKVKIDNEVYLVKLVVGVSNSNNRFYDHSLSDLINISEDGSESGSFRLRIPGTPNQPSSEIGEDSLVSGRSKLTNPGTPNKLSSENQYNQLSEILQVIFSKNDKINPLQIKDQRLAQILIDIFSPDLNHYDDNLKYFRSAYTDYNQTVNLATSLSYLKSNPHYSEAKNGDYEKAKELMNEILKNDKLDKFKPLFDQVKNDKEVWVIYNEGVENVSKNRIPREFAVRLNYKFGCKIEKLNQMEKVFHTGMKTSLERMFNTPAFKGNVIKGASYIIIDDVVSSGNTFAAMKGYIEHHGGQVKGMIALAKGQNQYANHLKPSDEDLQIIRDIYQDQLDKILVLIDPDLNSENMEGLTNAEARTLITKKREIFARSRHQGPIDPGRIRESGHDYDYRKSGIGRDKTTPEGKKSELSGTSWKRAGGYNEGKLYQSDQNQQDHSGNALQTDTNRSEKLSSGSDSKRPGEIVTNNIIKFSRSDSSDNKTPDEIINESKLNLRKEFSDQIKEYNKSHNTSFTINDDITETVLKRFRKSVDIYKSKSNRMSLFSYLVTPVSVHLQKISPKLADQVNKFEFSVYQKTMQDMDKVESFLVKLQKIKKYHFEDYLLLDIALKNSDMRVIESFADKYDFKEDLDKVRSVLNSLYLRAREVKFDINYRENYFPRKIKDVDAFIQFLNSFGFIDLPVGQIQKAIKFESEKAGRELSEVEIMKVIKGLITKQKDDMIKFEKISNYLNRSIPEINGALNEFYETSESALSKYITYANNQIELRRLFGMSDVRLVEDTEENILELIEDLRGEKVQKINSFNDYFLDQIKKDYAIAPEHEGMLIDILNARFNFKFAGNTVNTLKTLGYMTSMANFKSALSQLGDLAWAIIESPKYAASEVIKNFMNKKTITTKDLGLDQIAFEFSDGKILNKYLNRFFKLTGLTYLDNMTKNVLNNTVLSKYSEKANNNELTQQETEELIRIYGDEYDSFIQDLKDKKTSDNVKLFIFTRLKKYQPISLSEMPLCYLKTPNGRIFYMLKSFTIKQFSVIWDQHVKAVKDAKTPKEKVKAFQELMRVVGILMMCNVGNDYIKDLLFGRTFDLTDAAWDSFLRLFLVSKYMTYTFMNEGVVMFIYKMIGFPLDWLAYPMSDLMDLFKFAWQKYALDENPDSINPKDLETLQMIPVIGKSYYWWLGNGHEKVMKKIDSKKYKYDYDHQTQIKWQRSLDQKMYNYQPYDSTSEDIDFENTLE